MTTRSTQQEPVSTSGVAQRWQAAAAFARIAVDQVARAAAYPAAILGDVAGRRGVMHGRIQSVRRGMRVCGPAFTVEVRPGDNLMFHLALALARPGDVLVVDGRGDNSAAQCGGLMVAQAAAARLGGFVVDAAIRDVDELAAGDFPVFATGRCPCGPTKGLPGRLAVPVSVGGVSVSPGDLIIGDDDGVTVIPREALSDVLAAADAKVADEQQRIDEISRGLLVSPWLEAALRDAGVLRPDESVPW